MMLGPQTPFFAHLPEDPRFYQVAEQLYGDDVFGMAADANRYVGDTRWHPTTALTRPRTATASNSPITWTRSTPIPGPCASFPVRTASPITAN